MKQALHNTFLFIKLSNLAIAAEQLLNKKLAGKALVLYSDAKNKTIIACSKEAAQTGIAKGILLADARLLSPTAYFIKASTDSYLRFADKIAEWLYNSAPIVEKISSDQFYCSLPDSFSGDPVKWAASLKQNLEKEFGLVVTVGCGSTKLNALLAAGLNTGSANYLPDGCAQKELDLQPVSVLPFVTEKITQQLAGKGIRKVGVLRRLPKELLVSLVGKETGHRIWDLAHCHDTRSVTPNLFRMAISAQKNFTKPVISQTETKEALKHICQELAGKLIQWKKLTGSIVLRIEYAECRYIFRKIFVSYTNLAGTISKNVLTTYAKICDRKAKVISVSVSADDIINSGYQQLSLFTSEEKLPTNLPYLSLSPPITVQKPTLHSGIFGELSKRTQIARQ